jgi:hypothetical protein
LTSVKSAVVTSLGDGLGDRATAARRAIASVSRDQRQRGVALVRRPSRATTCAERLVAREQPIQRLEFAAAERASGLPRCRWTKPRNHSRNARACAAAASSSFGLGHARAPRRARPGRAARGFEPREQVVARAQPFDFGVDGNRQRVQEIQAGASARNMAGGRMSVMRDLLFVTR